MIRDVKAWENFERELGRREPVDYERNLALFEALLEEARALGRWPPGDPLEGIELDIRFAAALQALAEKEATASKKAETRLPGGATQWLAGERRVSRVREERSKGMGRMVADLLRRLGSALEKTGLPYMVIGGQAVLVHGEVRVTRDVDITLGVGPDALPEVLQVCRSIGLTCLVTEPEDFVKRTFVLPTGEDGLGLRVDFTFSTTGYGRVAIDRAVQIPVAGVPVRFASAEDLIIHKIFSGRPRDLEDVRGILRKQHVLDWALIRRWLEALQPVAEKELVSVFERLRREEWQN